ncbi:multidrug ABC transporter substrate-binding protein [Nibricoccus aquaticus]|uniref:Multidrug ABC transporter substrate-binding protein n=1 Tax=Nibricoccus aquaticus TaxID=2576891 RepID=A0A290QAQ2_9BACT|nr:ABC transporter permease [Nibricoccus aquaticus]ATC65604.1 multidrug ABC transporter substrate-binding protein [Nibricoccus aquaticus]
MRFVATLILAFRALRRNKLRSVLTALGMIIGVGAVIAMVSMGNGAKSQVEAQIAGLGQNLITIFPGSLTTGGMRGGWGSASTLTVEDAEAIKNEVSGAIGVSPEIRDRQQVLANGLNWNTQVLGESPDFTSIREWRVVEGEFFTENDVRTTAKVCVIGKTVADQLFAGTDPIGQNIRARNIPLRIVGVMAAKGFNTNGQDQDDIIIVPYTTSMKRISRRDRVSNIIVQAESQETMERVQRDITDLLQQRRQGREPDFTVRNQLEIAETATAASRTMTGLLAGIAFVSLVVGGIGIMNIMLVSVTERTREIGIRLAVGAHGKDVLLQFLTEAVVLSVLGGALGILLGIGTAQGLAFWKGWPVATSTSSIVIAFFFSAAVGIFFGFYPAKKAAALDPIDALRYE